MKLNIAESFLVLVHHPEKARNITDGNVLSAGLTGSIFLDLSLAENIVIENDRLIVKSVITKLPNAHKQILDKISDSPKTRKPKAWISRFSQRAGKPRRSIQESLEKKGVIDIEHKTFLFIPYIRTRLVMRSVRDDLIKEMRGIVFKDRTPDGQTASILGLIHACKLHKVICFDKEEQKHCKVRIKNIIESDMISQGVGKVIQEMQAAMMAAIIASTAATTATTAATS